MPVRGREIGVFLLHHHGQAPGRSWRGQWWAKRLSLFHFSMWLVYSVVLVCVQQSDSLICVYTFIDSFSDSFPIWAITEY